jgi:hypothetical protein
VDDRSRVVVRVLVSTLVWLALVIVINRGGWHHAFWNLASDVAIWFVITGVSTSYGRVSKRDKYQRAKFRTLAHLKYGWPVYFWGAVVALGIALLANSYWVEGAAVLAIPVVVIAWRGLRRLTADPWR